MEKSLAGQFLIAARQLRDPNFYRSVVLLVEHNDSGAMGLVVNRPSTLLVAQALKGHFELPDNGELVYAGGPVERAALFLVHNSATYGGDESFVVPGLYMGSNAEIFGNVMRAAQEGETGLLYRVYAGCAGWGAEQLDGEIARGDWVTVLGTAEAVFSEDPYELWEQLLEELPPLSFIPPSPPDPEWN